MTEEEQNRYAFALVKISDIAREARCIALQGGVLNDKDQESLFAYVAKLYAEVDELREIDKRSTREN